MDKNNFIERKLKDQWHQAKAAAAMHSGKSFNANMKKTSDGVMKHADMDSEMYFRAMEGYDRLRFDLPCGFDIAQLQKLFPEEMYAYQRWKNVRQDWSMLSVE